MRNLNETLLQSSEAQVLLVDLQEGALSVPGLTVSSDKLRRAAATVSRVAKIYSLPVTQTLVPGDGKPRSIDEVTAFHGDRAFVRLSPHAFTEAELVRSLEHHGRRSLAIGGVMAEVGLLYSVLGACAHGGFQVQVLVDLSAGLSERTERAAFEQMQSAGAIMTSIPSWTYAMVRDFATPQDTLVREVIREALR